MQVAVLLGCARRVERVGSGHVMVVLSRLLSEGETVRCNQKGGARSGRPEVRRAAASEV